MRWVALERCGNFRDVGGYPTSDGQVVRWRTVYRSSSTDALTARDSQCLRELGVRTVVDLRMESERATTRPAWIGDGGVEVVCLPSPNPPDAALRTGKYDAESLYIASLDDRARNFRDLLRVVSRPERLPVVVQCSGGKDRTGMLIALLLALLGVSDDDIVEDYALSDREARDPSDHAAALERVTAAGYDGEVLKARPATMRAFLDAVRRRQGSVREMALQFGASEVEVDRTIANLLEVPKKAGTFPQK